MNPTLQNITNKTLPVLKKYGIEKAAVFCSYARNEQKKDSDIDMLVQPAHGMSLLDFIGVKLDIEDALKMKVDLVSYNGLSPYLKDRILSEQKVIYER